MGLAPSAGRILVEFVQNHESLAPVGTLVLLENLPQQHADDEHLRQRCQPVDIYNVNLFVAAENIELSSLEGFFRQVAAHQSAHVLRRAAQAADEGFAGRLGLLRRPQRVATFTVTVVVGGTFDEEFVLEITHQARQRF